MRKKPVDIVIRYEHKVRELESIMLIKIEMERRGYSVAFTANYDYKNKAQYEPRVIVSPAIYNDEQFLGDITQYGLNKKIANLLWEQVMGIAEEESPTGAHNVYGTGQKAITFCWGKKSHHRLVAAGMSKENAKVVGQINTDLLRNPFTKLLATKEQLGAQYGVNPNVRWNLFISSFAYCELDEIQKDLIKKVYGDKYFEEFTDLSIKSRKALFSWFEAILEKYPDDVLIYRPHPDEMAKSIELKTLADRFPNFYVIADLSLKHWCHAADKVYNWYSTGMIDAVVLNKPCRILRPYFISDKYDYRLFYTADHIKKLDDFLEDYVSLDTTCGLDSKMVADYYHLPERFVYQDICDLLEEMLESNKYDIHYTKDEKKRFRKAYCRAEISRRLSHIKPLLSRVGLFKERFARKEARHKVLDEGFAKNVATEEELQQLYNLLKPIVYGQ